MAFEKKVPEWGAAGIEPPDSLKESGFTPGYKPPAEYFNWFMHYTGEAVKEVQEKALTADDKQVFCAVYGETSLTDISAAVKAEKFVYCDFSGMYAPLMGGIGGLFFTFCCGNDKDGYSFSIDTNGWTYTKYGGYTPKAHVDSHKTGGADALTPADIGAAPDGFGLGGNIQRLTTQAEMDAFTVSGWKSFYNVSTPLVAGGTKIYTGVVRCDAYSENYCVQTICSVGSGYFLQRICSYGEWDEWEWINPPLVDGVEYRTARRVNGYPVYMMAKKCGALPNATTKQVTFVSTSVAPLKVYGSVNHGYTIPSIDGTNKIYVRMNGGTVNIVTNYNASGMDCRVVAEYTYSY